MCGDTFTGSMMAAASSSAYAWLMLAGIGASLVLWSRWTRHDPRLLLIYFGALAGAFFGAKVVYLAAEGWLHWHDPNRWLILAAGKSITGALLGGYAGVEIAKAALGYQNPTGDWFAIIVPVSIMIGRVGCVLHGCCLGHPCDESWFTVRDAAGVARWPAAQVELLFNAVALGLILLMGRRKLWPGQHFHLYLVAYGLFRFLHEFLRMTPRILGSISGYQAAALAVAALGVVGFERRRREGLARSRPALADRDSSPAQVPPFVS
jgi:phosphatidylglycerol:prolipoprotein diacylglycerol transferase